ncbi:MAG: hypothetical protein ACREOC_15920 [Gemmatimonadales bacterium]
MAGSDRAPRRGFQLLAALALAMDPGSGDLLVSWIGGAERVVAVPGAVARRRGQLVGAGRRGRRCRCAGRGASARRVVAAPRGGVPVFEANHVPTAHPQLALPSAGYAVLVYTVSAGDVVAVKAVRVRIPR